MIPEGGYFFSRKQGSIAHSRLLSPFHRPDITEILLKKRKQNQVSPSCTCSMDATSMSCACVCNPILLTTFPEWLSGTQPRPGTPGAVRLSSSCLLCVCMHRYSFASLIRQFIDTAAITDHHSDTTVFQFGAHWVGIGRSIGSEKSFRHVLQVGVESSLDSLRERGTPYPLGQTLSFF